jgi:predicted RNA binding protein YcfA (HicA-like mRNA interferase family)
VTYRDLRAKLESLGCRFWRQADEIHEKWVNPANGRRAIIPRHSNRDLATGTLHQIRRDLGISRSDFDQG